MVVPSRDLVNTFFSSSSNFQNTQQKHSLTQEIDIEIDMTRSQSKTLSPKSSRKSSVHSDVLFMDYVERVKILANIKLKMKNFEILCSSIQ